MTLLRLIPSAYRTLLASAAVRRALVAGVLLRLPGAAMFPTLTLLCVTRLGTSYAAAGIASATYTIAAALTAPLMGRMVDARGVRWVGLRVLPVNVVVWLALGRAPYEAVVLLAAVAGATCLPFWGISRQLVLRAAPAEGRSTALSLDSVGTEIAYIAGPAAGIGLATTAGADVAVTAAGLAISLGIAVLTLYNPVFTAAQRETGPKTTHLRSPLKVTGMPALLTMTVIVATTLVGTDLLLLAKLRDVGDSGAYAFVAAVWAAGSMVGGLIYGARPRGWAPGPLTVVLSILTAGIALAHGGLSLALAGFIAGLGCAPVMTALTDEITRRTPARQHSEALGWYSSAHTAGASMGSTAVGAAIDALGSTRAVLATVAAGALLAAALTVAMGSHNRPGHLESMPGPDTP